MNILNFLLWPSIKNTNGWKLKYCEGPIKHEVQNVCACQCQMNVNV